MLTPFGFGLLFLVIIAGIITWKITLRQKSGKNLLWKGFVFFVVFILFSLTTGIPYFTLPKVHKVLTLPRYEGKVVGHHSYYTDFTDDVGYKKVRMYQPYVTFTDTEGNQIKILADLASDKPKEIGSFLTIGFAKGVKKATVISKMSLLLLTGAGLLFLLTAYFSVMAIAYAMGRDIKPILRFGHVAIITFVVPLGLAGSCAVFAYLSYSYFSGRRSDIPLWGVGICVLFSIVLFFATWGYLKRLFKVKPRVNNKI